MRGSKNAGEVLLHLDSYVTAQFAGVCVAVRRGIYSARGVDVGVEGVREPGREVDDVVEAAERAEVATTSKEDVNRPLRVGVTEQYILQERGRGRGLTAFGAMFGQSPLALVGIAPSSQLSSQSSQLSSQSSQLSSENPRQTRLASRLCADDVHRAYPLRVGVHEDTLPLLWPLDRYLQPA